MLKTLKTFSPGVSLVTPEGFDAAALGLRSIAERCLAFSGGGGDPPPPRNLYDETSGELKAKVDSASAMLAAERLYRPQYQALDVANLQSLINGTPAGKRSETYTEMEHVDPVYGYKWSGGNGWGPQQRQIVTPGYDKPVSRTRDVSDPGTRGLLDIFQNDILPRERQITSDSRLGEIQDVEQLGPRATSAFRDANPEQAALMAKLNEQAQQELDAGAHLDPSLAREVSQGVRQGQSARGMGMGMNDLADETMMRGLTAEQLRRARQAFAAGVVGLNQQTSVDPFMAILGRPSQALQGANSFTGAGLNLGKSLGPTLFGSSVNANDVFSSNFNAASAKAIADNNSSAAMTSAGIGAGGAIAGGLLIAL